MRSTLRAEQKGDGRKSLVRKHHPRSPSRRESTFGAWGTGERNERECNATVSTKMMVGRGRAPHEAMPADEAFTASETAKRETAVLLRNFLSTMIPGTTPALKAKAQQQAARGSNPPENA